MPGEFVSQTDIIRIWLDKRLGIRLNDELSFCYFLLNLMINQDRHHPIPHHLLWFSGAKSAFFQQSGLFNT
jgi:hypothetical protein